MPDAGRELIFVGPSREDLRAFPAEVRQAIGFALFIAERGGRHVDAKPLKGFGGAGVLEVVEDHDGSTYRAVYTVRLAGRVYVLHAFQKKAKKGLATPRHELELVRDRLKEAQAIHKEWLAARSRAE